MADVSMLDLGRLSRESELDIMIESGSDTITFYADGEEASGTSMIDEGSPVPATKDYVLRNAERVRVTTRSGYPMDLEEPGILLDLAPLLGPALQYVRRNTPPTAQRQPEVVPVHEGVFRPGPISHDNHHGGHPKEAELQTPQGKVRVRMARCIDCQLHWLGRK